MNDHDITFRVIDAPPVRRVRSPWGPLLAALRALPTGKAIALDAPAGSTPQNAGKAIQHACRRAGVAPPSYRIVGGRGIVLFPRPGEARRADELGLAETYECPPANGSGVQGNADVKPVPVAQSGADAANEPPGHLVGLVSAEIASLGTSKPRSGGQSAPINAQRIGAAERPAKEAR
jgi:hypothetical protein